VWQGGAGQRWNFADDAVLRKHDVVRFQTRTAPLVQTFEPAGGRSVSINLSFLSSRPKLGRVLVTTFWMTYQARPRRKTVLAVAWVLKIFCLFLDRRAKSMPDILEASDLSADLLKEFAVWLVVERRLQRKTAATVYGTCACFLRRAKRAFAEDFDSSFRTPRHLFDGADGDRAESQALSGSDFQKILVAAERDVQQIRQAYKAGDVPTSAQQLIPLMVLIAARTGMNTFSLYGLGRGCLVPHELDEKLFYCVWDKPRAGKQQRQIHRAGGRNQNGVVELIRFLRQYTEPLASRAGPAERTKLFLYLGQRRFSDSSIVSPSTTSGDSFVGNFREFVERHALPHFSLVNMRASAATQLYLETGGNLRKVQQFLQHARLSTTVKYLLSSITEPFHARVIQKAQEKMLERITVVPEKRATGVSQLNLPKAQARKIAAGRFDTGCGSCRDPYDSPQPGEEKGRPCTSFHACFSCPNGLWFLDDLPQVIAMRNRLVSFESDMKAKDWEAVYGESVRIINEQIIAAFRPEQIKVATEEAARGEQIPVIIAKGVLA
jgi:hypothetical protein